MFSSNRFLLSLTGVLICTMVFISWQLQSGIEDKTRTELAVSLNTVLGTSHQAVRSWTKEHLAATKVWANTAEIRAATKSLLAQSHDQQALLESAAQAEIRAWLRPVLTGKGYQGSFIIDADQINLASSQEQNIGQKNLLITQETKYLNVVYVPLASDQVMVHTYDLTKRERAEEALHENEHIIECSSKNPPSGLPFAEGVYES